MKRSSPAKPTISSKRAVSSRLDRPRIEPFKNTFSRPDSSGWKPDPSSSRAAIFPWVRMRPVSGRRILAMHFSRVDLPEPFSPTRPYVVPSSISRETSRRAQNSSKRARPPRITAAFRDRFRSWYSRKRLLTPSTTTAGSATAEEAAPAPVDRTSKVRPPHGPGAEHGLGLAAPPIHLGRGLVQVVPRAGQPSLQVGGPLVGVLGP